MSEPKDIRKTELISKVIYIPESNEFVQIINEDVFRLSYDQGITLHNQFTTAVTQELLNRLGE